MSYILEALKKAQAERQLGSAPTLHAVPVGAPPSHAVRKRRLPLLALGGAVLALAVAAAVWRMRAPAPAPPAALAVVAAPPGPAAVAPPAMVVVPPSTPAPVKPHPVKAAPHQEAKLPSLAELPDAVRGSVPQVSFSGYMYSANPADRLVLVDKALRHEGDEVAPGLVLEKLLPKSAVMNYKGYRYLVPL